MNRGRVAIIGAGPMGLEAAAYASHNGYDVTVLEQGDAVAAHVRDWGHVRLFSPFAMNASPWGRRLLEQSGHSLPPGNALLTGAEFVEAYLEPLAGHPALRDTIRLRSRVVSVGRPGVLKTDLPAEARLGRPFRLLVETRGGHGEGTVREWDLWADIVLDCSGTYGQPNWVGAGGAPCPGERDFLTQADHRILRPDCECVSGSSPGAASGQSAQSRGERYLQARFVVVGAGYSAATSVLNAAQSADAGDFICWVTRRADRETPIPIIADDPLPERRRVTEQANALATGGRRNVRWMRGFEVARITRGRTRRLRVELHPAGVASAAGVAGDTGTAHATGRPDQNPKDASAHSAVEGQGGGVAIECDRLIANVGYRPDWELLRELQVHQCYATEGPIKLAAALLGEGGADCLATTSVQEAALLQNPEPNLFVLGAKSFGRNSNFLLATGQQQIRHVFDTLL